MRYQHREMHRDVAAAEAGGRLRGIGLLRDLGARLATVLRVPVRLA